MNLPEISIRRPVMAWMLMTGIFVFGMISYQKLGVSNLPDVDFPVVSVSLSLNGAAPEVMEAQVIDPIEDAIMEIDGVRNVTSSAQQSSGSISVEFDLARNIDDAMQEIQNKIQQVQNILPTNLFPPTLRKTNPEDNPIIWLTLTSDHPQTKPIDLMIYARNTLYDQFSILPGVGNIALGGYVDPALRVWARVKRLADLNLTSTDLIQAITQEHLEVPAGRIEDDRHETYVRTMGEATTPQEFGQLQINNRALQGPTYKPIFLADVTEIQEGLTDVRKISRVNGKRTVALGVIKQHGANAVDVAASVVRELHEIEPALPSGYHLAVRVDNTRFIKDSVRELVFTLCLSALLTSIVCYLFLGSFTSTLNVLLSIPTSIIGAFISFYAFGFTLNTFTLLGLSLAIGIVVDDSIMMLENIVRHREMGQGKKAAALNGATEITFAALAATLAVVAIFMPVVFMRGIIGRYFLQYGLTVTVAVLLSLLEALTLTPMRCSRYLALEHPPRGLASVVEKIFHRLANTYRRILVRLLRFPKICLLVTCTLFIGSLWVGRHLPSEMMPAQDQSMVLLRFKLPVGTALPVTDQKMKIVEDYLQTLPEIETVFSTVGGFGGDAVNQGSAFVTLVPPKKRQLSQSKLITKLRGELKSKVPGMQIVIQDLSLRGFSASRGFPVEFIVQGPNWETLTSATEKMMQAMREAGYVTDVNTDVQQGMPEIDLVPDREAISRFGASVNSVANVVNALMGGLILTGQTEYPKGRHRYEIEVRLIAEERSKEPDLNQILVRNNRGLTIELSKLVKHVPRKGLMLISRLNRSRAITVYANPANGHSQDQALKHTETLARSLLPPGYSLKMMGTSQSYRESFESLLVALVLGIVVSYMVLASQFNSFIHPITVLTALPFSVSGAFIGLFVTRQSINMYSLIGLILLMGIVKKNSILLVDFTNQKRAEGLSIHEALIQACPVRLRPIIMTSTATVVAALPEALSLGPGSETTIPMAIAIIGGVIASTFLTLFAVPCVYALLSRFERPDPLAHEDRLLVPANPALA